MKKLLIFVVIVIIVIVGFLFFNRDNLTTKHSIITNRGFTASGDGLYLDNDATGKNEELPYASKYYFKGNNLSNYFWYENLCFSIVNIANNDTIKIVYFGKSNDTTCNKVTPDNYNWQFSINRNNDWLQSNILELFQDWQGRNILFEHHLNYENDAVFTEADWYIGSVDGSDRTSDNYLRTLKDHIDDERSGDVYRGYIGLISVSDYLKASSGIQHSYAKSVIPKENYLFHDLNFWTINADKNDTGRVFAVTAANLIDDGVTFPTNKDSLLRIVYADDATYTFYPALYLNSDINLTGSGSLEDPYKVR